MDTLTLEKGYGTDIYSCLSLGLVSSWEPTVLIRWCAGEGSSLYPALYVGSLTETLSDISEMQSLASCEEVLPVAQESPDSDSPQEADSLCSLGMRMTDDNTGSLSKGKVGLHGRWTWLGKRATQPPCEALLLCYIHGETEAHRCRPSCAIRK